MYVLCRLLMYLTKPFAIILSTVLLGMYFLTSLNSVFYIFFSKGPEKHQLLLSSNEESSLDNTGSVYEKKPIVGDQIAKPVLDCLIYIAHLYGEPVLTYQYLPYIGYLVSLFFIKHPFLKKNFVQSIWSILYTLIL